MSSTEVTDHRDHFRWQELVLARPDLTNAEKVIAIRLALFRNIRTGLCNPSYGRLAKDACVNVSTAKRAIAALEALRFLTVYRTKNNDASEHERNRYSFW